jgi:two-component system sensor histidine kinase YesM
MALMNDQEEISELTMALSDIFRYAVKGGNIATVRNEVENLEKYAKIIEYRFMGKIKMLIEADEDVMDCPIIKLILQPIVENAVFHGLEPKMGDGLVQTTITRVNDRIRIVVEDD